MGKTDRERFVALAFCRADLLFELDQNYNIIFAAGMTPILGADPDSLKNKSFLDFIGDEHRQYAQDLMNAGGRNARVEDVIFDIKRADGRTIPVVFAGYRMPDFDDHFFLAVKVDPVSKTHIDLSTLTTNKDSGLLDQESFRRLAAERVQDYGRTGAEGHLTYLRLAHMKKATEDLAANERQGLLSAVGEILKSHSLGGNTAGQLDDENFAYVHADAVDPEAVNMKVLDAAEGVLGPDNPLEARSSTVDTDGAGLDEDQVAKALVHTMQQFCTGKGKVTIDKLSENLVDMMADTVETARFIKEVTERCDFDLVFMPICDLKDGMVHHFEALSRFRDQERAKSTFQIITLAEELGLIPDYDFAVLRQVIDIMGHMTRRGELPAIAINVSSMSLAKDVFVDRMLTVLDGRADLNQQLMFELTESAEAEELESLNNVIQEIRNRGFKFCLDDFGAGSASFDYLNALDVDVVKFDGPVVRRACASQKGGDMLTSMAKMCANAGVHTVAEMVEDQAAADKLLQCGIDFGQGWHFGKPNNDPFVFVDRFVGRK